MSFAMPEREFVSTDHEPLAFLDFPSQLKLDFLGLDMSPTHVDHMLGHTSGGSASGPISPSSSASSEPTQLHAAAAVAASNKSSTTRSTRATPMSEADQRAKNRLIVKRCYYKKINTLNELRAQMESIEAEYNALLAARHAAAATPSPPRASDAQPPSSFAQLHDAYVQLLQLKSAMQKENSELRRLEAQYLAMEKQMQQLYSAETKAITTAMLAHDHKRRHAAVTIRPLSPTECLDIAARSYREILAFRASKTLQSTGASIFGWTDRYKTVKNEKLMFSLDKTFHGHAAADLADRTWRVLSTPALLEKTYSPNVDVSFQLVQRVSDDAVVYYHTLERGAADMRIHALVLATRVDLGGGRGCMILFRGLDPAVYLRSETENGTRDRRGRTKLEPQKEKIWMDTFTWGIFEAVGDFGEHCRDDYGGVVEGTKLVDASWWVLETLLIALRVEAQVVGPQVVLTAS